MDNKEVQNNTNLDQPVVSPQITPEPAPEAASVVQETPAEPSEQTTPTETKPAETPAVETPAPAVAPVAPVEQPAEPTTKEASAPVESNDATVSAIANSESREFEEKVQGQEQTSADFTSMFGVASEEQPEKKSYADIPIKLAPVEETIVREPELSPEQKKANHQQNFNADEKIIYEIKPEKQRNPIVVVFFFIALVVFIGALPKISKNYDLIEYFTGGKNKPEEKKEPTETDFYLLDNAAVRARIGTLELTNFVIGDPVDGDYTISFTIQNVGDKLYQFDKKYYVVLYDQDKIVYRALIHSYEGIAPRSGQEISLIINEKAHRLAKRFKVEEIIESEYPDVQITNNSGNYGVLTCTYNYNTIEYYFLDNKLAKIKETYKEEFEKSYNYETHKARQKALQAKYEAIPNFDSTFVETSSYFTLVNEFNLADVPDTSLAALKNYRYFKYNADKNVVNFEIEAQGYFCS